MLSGVMPQNITEFQKFLRDREEYLYSQNISIEELGWVKKVFNDLHKELDVYFADLCDDIAKYDERREMAKFPNPESEPE